MAVDVDDGDHLEESHDHEPDGSSEGVKHLQPILAGTRCEDQSDEEAKCAYYTWEPYNVILSSVL